MAKLMGEFLQLCVPHTTMIKNSVFMDIFISKLMDTFFILLSRFTSCVWRIRDVIHMIIYFLI